MTLIIEITILITHSQRCHHGNVKTNPENVIQPIKQVVHENESSNQ